MYAPGPLSISVNSKDIDGNTILHLAAKRRQFKMVSYLLDSNDIGVDLDIANNDQCKALDMFEPKEMDDLEIGCFDYREAVFKQRVPSVNTLMVVAVMIASIAFQAATNPPGGVFQDDSKVDSLTDPVMFSYYLSSVINNTEVSGKFGSYLQNLPQQNKTSRHSSGGSNITADEIITNSANLAKALLNTTFSNYNTSGWKRVNGRILYPTTIVVVILVVKVFSLTWYDTLEPLSCLIRTQVTTTYTCLVSCIGVH